MADLFPAPDGGAPDLGLQTSPPKDDQERAARVEGWKAFIMKMNELLQDPVKGRMIGALGTELLKTNPFGQDLGDAVARGVERGNESIQAFRSGQEKARQFDVRTQVDRERILAAEQQAEEANQTRLQVGREANLAREKVAEEQGRAQERMAEEKRKQVEANTQRLLKKMESMDNRAALRAVASARRDAMKAKNAALSGLIGGAMKAAVDINGEFNPEAFKSALDSALGQFRVQSGGASVGDFSIEGALSAIQGGAATFEEVSARIDSAFANNPAEGELVKAKLRRELGRRGEKLDKGDGGAAAPSPAPAAEDTGTVLSPAPPPFVPVPAPGTKETLEEREKRAQFDRNQAANEVAAAGDAFAQYTQALDLVEQARRTGDPAAITAAEDAVRITGNHLDRANANDMDLLTDLYRLQTELNRMKAVAQLQAAKKGRR